MKKIIILSVLITTLVVGSGAFYGGMKYAESKNVRRFSQNDQQNLTLTERQARIQQMGASGLTAFGGVKNGNRGGSVNANFVMGQIIAKDDKSITVKLSDGGSKIIFYSDSVSIGKITSGVASDLEIGKNITINGTADQDGSLTAKSIQINE